MEFLPTLGGIIAILVVFYLPISILISSTSTSREFEAEDLMRRIEREYIGKSIGMHPIEFIQELDASRNKTTILQRIRWGLLHISLILFILAIVFFIPYSVSSIIRDCYPDIAYTTWATILVYTSIISFATTILGIYFYKIKRSYKEGYIDGWLNNRHR